MKDVAKERAQLAQYRASSGNLKEMQQALEHDARTVAVEAGMTPLSGTGMTLTIRNDPRLPFYKQFAGQFQQNSDVEISQIVNELFGDGATAMSINSQRLVTTSSIRLVSGLGNFSVLRLNLPITSPYQIRQSGTSGHESRVDT